MEHPLTKYRAKNSISFEAFGERLGVNKSTVLRWEADRIPAERVIDIERITGIPRHQLRPDLYPMEKSA